MFALPSKGNNGCFIEVNFVYRLTFQWTEAGTPKSQTLALREVNGRVGTIRIGRDAERADLAIDDPDKRVSRQHVEIFFNASEQRFYARNLTRNKPAGSQNPAIIDGQRAIAEELPLKADSTIEIGTFVVVLTEIEGPSAKDAQQSAERPVFGVKCPNGHLISYEYLGLVCPHCGEAVQAGETVQLFELAE